MLKQINNNLRCYDLAMELSNSTLEALPQNYAEQVIPLCHYFLYLLSPGLSIVHESSCILPGAKNWQWMSMSKINKRLLSFHVLILFIVGVSNRCSPLVMDFEFNFFDENKILHKICPIKICGLCFFSASGFNLPFFVCNG